MAARRQETEEVEHGPVGRALSTSVHGNSQAFGFSITVTASFGMLTHLEGPPASAEIIYFAIAAAAAIAGLEAAVSRGFRVKAVHSPSRVQMLGTAMNMLSVAGALALALLAAEIVAGTPAWPTAGFVAALGYVALEAAELLVAEAIQSARGDPEAGEEEPE